MPSGSRTVEKPIEEVRDRLRMMLAAANFTVVDDGGTFRFQHGTYLTHSAPSLPKSGFFRLSEDSKVTEIAYEIHIAGIARAWMIFVAVLTCWAIFPPILVYRALEIHPKRFADNILAGL